MVQSYKTASESKQQTNSVKKINLTFPFYNAKFTCVFGRLDSLLLNSICHTHSSSFLHLQNTLLIRLFIKYTDLARSSRPHVLRVWPTPLVARGRTNPERSGRDEQPFNVQSSQQHCCPLRVVLYIYRYTCMYMYVLIIYTYNSQSAEAKEGGFDSRWHRSCLWAVTGCYYHYDSVLGWYTLKTTLYTKSPLMEWTVVDLRIIWNLNRMRSKSVSSSQNVLAPVLVSCIYQFVVVMV